MMIWDLYAILLLAVLAGGIAINDHLLAASARQPAVKEEVKE